MRTVRSPLFALLLLTGLVTFAGCGQGAATPTIAPNSGAEDQTAQRFAVTGAASVVADIFRGEIQVIEGEGGVVELTATKVAYLSAADAVRAEFAKIAISISQDRNAVVVRASAAAQLDPRTTVRLRLVVPAATALQLTNGFGSVVTDVNSATLKANVMSGSIVVRGSLAEGEHSLRVTSGNIKLTLPTEASFSVDASVGLGSIKSDFMLTRTDRATTSALKGDVGPAPRTSITLTVGSGSIALLAGAGGS